MVDRILYVVGQSDWPLYYNLFYHHVGVNPFSEMYVCKRCFVQCYAVHSGMKLLIFVIVTKPLSTLMRT